jgi:hypothetical protein
MNKFIMNVSEKGWVNVGVWTTIFFFFFPFCSGGWRVSTRLHDVDQRRSGTEAHLPCQRFAVRYHGSEALLPEVNRDGEQPSHLLKLVWVSFKLFSFY